MDHASNKHKAIRQLGCIAAAVMALGMAVPAQALVINLTSTGSPNADAGFQRAADFWEGVFIDPITVNITAGFASLGGNILGQAGSTFHSSTLSLMKAALAADATSTDDATMVAGLPGCRAEQATASSSTAPPMPAALRTCRRASPTWK